MAAATGLKMTRMRETAPRPGAYSLPFDVVRRFAQPLGIHLDEWESRIINTEKGVVRLIPVRDRGKQLFGDAGASVLADELETAAAYDPQLSLFPEAAPTVHGRPRRGGAAGRDRRSRRLAERHHARPHSRRDAAAGLGSYTGASSPVAG